jgi:hypothetical protein
MIRRKAVWPLAGLLALLAFQAAPAAPEKKSPKIRSVDTYVVGDKNFVPGTRASLRIVTLGVTGLVTSRPMPLARVTVTLQREGRRKATLFSGRSDLLGIVDAKFQVPTWADGSYEMTVKTQTPFGQGEVKQSIILKRTGKLLMVTDKPIYQPNQVIHMRTLALNSHNLIPLANEELRFEVQDPKGNKVFKKKVKTNDYGVASTTFQLADEINLGNYQIETVCERKDAAEPAQKTVVVKKYVLPKFKVEVSTDRDYYLPKETIKGKIQSDYFFGKPVAGGEVEVKASTFDVAFKEFATLRGRTDKDGKWEFELKLPDYFVGQPLQKGDAVVKLDIKLTDTAKHAEKSTKSVPVAATPIRLDAVPEGGRLVAGVENRIYVVATYPDGSPAGATVVMKKQGEETGRTRTDETGLGFFVLTPEEKEMRPGPWEPRGSFGRDRRRFNVQPQNVQKKVLDVSFEAKDEKGNTCTVSKSFSTDPAGDKVLLRTDKAIYSAGDIIQGTLLTTTGGGTCYLDIIKNRQTILTKSVRLEKGRGTFKVPIGPDVFGTVEMHGYKILANGEIMRDARVLYVQPPRDLAIEISRDKSVYRPGEDALIKFRVMDGQQRPAAAAIGIIIVDEAVYALQELKPGLEKVYFTLEKELSDPKYQIEFGPSESMASLIKADKLQTQKQQVAKVLLAKAEPQGDPSLWHNPLVERMQKAQNDRYAIQNALYNWGQQHPIGRRTKEGKWVYPENLIREMVKGNVLNKQNAKDPLGDPYTMKTAETLWPELKAESYLAGQELNRLWNFRSYVYNQLYSRTNNFTKISAEGLETDIREAISEVVKQNYAFSKDLTGKPYTFNDLKEVPSFRVKDFVDQAHVYRVQRIYSSLSSYGYEGERWYRISVLDKKTDSYILPKDVLKRVVKRKYLNKNETKDLWGHTFRLKKLKEARKQIYYDNRLRFYLVYSVGPDGKDGTQDDIEYSYPQSDGGYQELITYLGYTQPVYPAAPMGGVEVLEAEVAMDGAQMGGFGGGGRGRPMARAAKAAAPPMAAAPMEEKRMERTLSMADKGEAGPAAPKKRQVRVREFFPETLLFEPSLITDKNGEANLKLTVADSITTWRMTASANSKQGGLGSVSHGIRVFQDFFVDIDLPVSLTQNDELSIPIVVYNYLKKPQRVRLEMDKGDWFELKGGTVQEMTLDPNEVSATYYRIKVIGLGNRTLQVRADGSSMSDAIKRQIEVLPDGKEQNVAYNGRLEGTVAHTVSIPDTAVAGASKIIVRMYPGVFSQVIEGMESMLRLPGG